MIEIENPRAYAPLRRVGVEGSNSCYQASPLWGSVRTSPGFRPTRDIAAPIRSYTAGPDALVLPSMKSSGLESDARGQIFAPALPTAAWRWKLCKPTTKIPHPDLQRRTPGPNGMIVTTLTVLIPVRMSAPLQAGVAARATYPVTAAISDPHPNQTFLPIKGRVI